VATTGETGNCTVYLRIQNPNAVRQIVAAPKKPLLCGRRGYAAKAQLAENEAAKLSHSLFHSSAPIAISSTTLTAGSSVCDGGEIVSSASPSSLCPPFSVC